MGSKAWEASTARDLLVSTYYNSHRVQVATQYILRAQRGSHIATLGPKFILCSYMDPLEQAGVTAALESLTQKRGLTGSYPQSMISSLAGR